MRRPLMALTKTLLVLLAAGLAVPRPLGAEISFLKGRVVDLTSGEMTLEQGLSLAEKEFRSSEKGTAFLTAYSYLSRCRVRSRRNGPGSVPYRIRIEGDHINLHHAWYNDGGQTFESRTGSIPAVVLFLHRVQDGKDGPVDLQLIDPDDIHELPAVPAYWLGDAGNEESLTFLKKAYQTAPLSFQKSLVFAISTHGHPQASEFLRKVSAGEDDIELRKTALLFFGSAEDEGAVPFLKDLYAGEKSREMKKHIIFVLSTVRGEESVRELVRLARSEAESGLRRDAIFWLGQKASQEAVRALKDFVEGDEDQEIKKQALFAISQLPKDKAVPMLLEIAKTNDNPSVRKNAIFWLGQTGDERALTFLEDLLLGKKR